MQHHHRYVISLKVSELQSFLARYKIMISFDNRHLTGETARADAFEKVVANVHYCCNVSSSFAIPMKVAVR